MAIREEFLIQRQGKTFVLYQGLLDEAHERGLRSIETELLSKVLDENHKPLFADFRATVTMEDGSAYTGYGDASRDSVGKMIHSHLLRMAETRAKARALRDAINVGVAALEELGGEDNEAPAYRSETQTQQQSGPPTSATRQSQRTAPEYSMLPAQIAKIEHLSKQLKYKVPDLSGYNREQAVELLGWLEDRKQERDAS